MESIDALILHFTSMLYDELKQKKLQRKNCDAHFQKFESYECRHHTTRMSVKCRGEGSSSLQTWGEIYQYSLKPAEDERHQTAGTNITFILTI